MEEKKKGLSGEGGRGQTVRTGTSILSSSTGYGCTFVPSFAEKGKATVLLIRGGTGFCEGWSLYNFGSPAKEKQYKIINMKLIIEVNIYLE